jgi:hypothetical protein
MTHTLEYLADVLCGTLLIAASLFHLSPLGYAAFGLGVALVLWAVVGSNVAAWVAAKRQAKEEVIQ